MLDATLIGWPNHLPVLLLVEFPAVLCACYFLVCLCPQCRNKVERINKNHIVNNLVDAYLRANPDKKRDPEDLQDLDARNKITHDMVKKALPLSLFVLTLPPSALSKETESHL